MTKPTIVTNSANDVEIMASEAMPESPAVRFGRWVVFFCRNREPEVMTIDEVEVQDEINRQAKERRRMHRR